MGRLCAAANPQLLLRVTSEPVAAPGVRTYSAALRPCARHTLLAVSRWASMLVARPHTAGMCPTIIGAAGAEGVESRGGRGGRSHSDDGIHWCDLSTSGDGFLYRPCCSIQTNDTGFSMLAVSLRQHQGEADRIHRHGRVDRGHIRFPSASCGSGAVSPTPTPCGRSSNPAPRGRRALAAVRGATPGDGAWLPWLKAKCRRSRRR